MPNCVWVSRAICHSLHRPQGERRHAREAATYRARAMQIGTEAFYVMARAAELRAR